MTHRWKAIAAMCAIAAAPVFAQTKPADAQPVKKGSPDRAFALEAALGGMAEVELGNLAKEKAASHDVKQFGDRMVTDHSKANEELKQWAQQKSIGVPPALDAKHKALRDRLAKLSGDAFDKAYMHEMVTDHQQDVAAFKREATAGKDADFRAWAAKTLPTLQQHLQMAKVTATKIGAGAHAARGKAPADKTNR